MARQSLLAEQVDPAESTAPCQMIDPTAIRRFALAGNAILTLQSERTSKHLTYKIRKPEPDADDIWFVNVLGDPGYRYIGILRPKAGRLEFRHTMKSTVSTDSLSFKGFEYFWKHIEAGHVPPHMKVQHEGCCGRCSRPLTDPDSIDRGLGPDCAAMMGVA